MSPMQERVSQKFPKCQKFLLNPNKAYNKMMKEHHEVLREVQQIAHAKLSSGEWQDLGEFRVYLWSQDDYDRG